jgi:hypothetical protein
MHKEQILVRLRLMLFSSLNLQASLVSTLLREEYSNEAAAASILEKMNSH